MKKLLDLELLVYAGKVTKSPFLPLYKKMLKEELNKISNNYWKIIK